jgi:predicted Zn-dependent protease
MKASGMMPAEIQDAGVQRYVEHLARRIASHSDLRIPISVTVLESNDIDAMGLPGGFLYVTSGLLRACESEDQLAGVLAREIAHIAARHGAQHSKRSLISKILVPAARVATGVFTGGTVNAGTYYGLNYGFQGLQSIVDRTLIGSGNAAQKEADQLGIQYAWNAGFDPKGFIQFLDSLSKQREYSRSESWFQLKPSLDARLMDAFTEIQFLPVRDRSNSNSADFQSVLKR